MSTSVKRVSIAIPASVVSDTPHLREKTSKIGLIGRASAIFRVGEIVIYQDNAMADQSKEMDLTASLLTYMETPQYLRKRLFKLSPELQYAGILPPLRTPHHPLNRRSKNLRLGEYREGVAVARTDSGTLVDIGVEKHALARSIELHVGSRITVRVVRKDKTVEVELTSRHTPSEYWGYSVQMARQSFSKMLKSRSYGLIIATSRYGLPFARAAEQIIERWKRADNILVAFGSPSIGLREIVGREGLRLEDVTDFTVNTIPMQGTATVRTEEAIIVSMACLNIALQSKT